MLYNLIVLFFQVTIFSIILSFGLKIIGTRLRWFDKDPHGIHKGESHRVITFGGIAIYLSYWLGAYIFLPQLLYMPSYYWIWSASTLILLVGIIDDTLELSPLVKSLGILLAAHIVYFFARVTFSSALIQGHSPLVLNAVSYLATIGWIYFVTNAINIIDGVDGLASSVSIISLSTLAITTYLFSRSLPITLITLLVLLVAAITGFLPFNWAPAKIYLGDTGALFIGFMYATLSVNSLKHASLYSLIVPVIIYSLPLFDITYAMGRRFLAGKPITKGDSEHLHHRLIRFGFSKRQVVLFFIFITLIFSVIAICSYLWPQIRWVWLLMTVIMLVGLVYIMKRLGKLMRLEKGRSLYGEESKDTKRK